MPAFVDVVAWNVLSTGPPSAKDAASSPKPFDRDIRRLRKLSASLGFVDLNSASAWLLWRLERVGTARGIASALSNFQSPPVYGGGRSMLPMPEVVAPSGLAYYALFSL